MAHRKVEAPVPQAAHTIGYGTSHSHAEAALKDFSRCVVALRTILYQDRPLERVEFLFMEKHMQVLQMAYLRWKRKHEWPMGLR